MSLKIMMLSDAQVRHDALNPAHSFCVTAPAGSGKTGLLTQRLLTLLSRVDRPEQVLAITFTRKAAAEMRERLFAALTDAARDAPCTNDFEILTRELAQKVLTHASRRGWRVEPNVFNIRTIDGLCAYIVRHTPITSHVGGAVKATDNAEPLYQEAVESLFAHCQSRLLDDEPVGRLLTFCGNDWLRLRGLLVTMLARRGDWMPMIGSLSSAEDSRDVVTELVESVIEDAIARCVQAIGRTTLDAMLAEITPAVDRLHERWRSGEASKGTVVPPNVDFSCTDKSESVLSWRWLAKFLVLNTANSNPPQVRKRLNAQDGFDAKADKASRSRLSALLEDQRENVAFINACVEISHLPSAETSEAGWRSVLDLAEVLPTLAAHLMLVFQRHGVVDHTHIALAAENALGEDDAPSDLALRLDYQLEHILVDEFQDTSEGQFRLLEKICRGWAEHNHTGAPPRTLFLVGDAMQSIYGFRHANVSLFMRARETGLAGLSIRSLSLQTNFRSQKNLVDWCNSTFSQYMPSDDDLRLGAVSHSKAQSFHPGRPGPSVSMHAFPYQAAAQEADAIRARIEEILHQEPTASIAVLGRTRHSLRATMDALRSAKLPFTGVDIDPLDSNPAVSDLLSLIRWLANPADGIAALSLLRSTWVGLSIEEITRLCGSNGSRRGVDLLEVLAQRKSALSRDAELRAAHLEHCLTWALLRRDRLAPRVWVEQVWLRLGGPASTTPAQWPDIEQFLDLVEQASEPSGAVQYEALRELLSTTYRATQMNPGSIQLMTLHKSKGLQFDHILIPDLLAKIRSSDKELLRWARYEGRVSGWLWAASPDEQEASLYDYLNWLNKSREVEEYKRLMYVGITRARHSVWLSGTLKHEPKNWPVEIDSLGGLLGPVARCAPSALMFADPVPVEKATISGASQLRRFVKAPTHSETWTLPEGSSQQAITVGNLSERSFGIALHRAFELLTKIKPLPSETPTNVLQAASFLYEDMSGQRPIAANIQASLQSLCDKALHDQQGRWFLGEHLDAYSELALSYEGQMIVIDRTFIDQTTETRWVIDYKSSCPLSHESLDAFLENEATKYSPQLSRYVSAIQQWDQQRGRSLATRCALYFPRIGVLHELLI
jgi:ATP-dependent helicase/nuclease subunit A